MFGGIDSEVFFYFICFYKLHEVRHVAIAPK